MGGPAALATTRRASAGLRPVPPTPPPTTARPSRSPARQSGSRPTTVSPCPSGTKRGCSQTIRSCCARQLGLSHELVTDIAGWGEDWNALNVRRQLTAEQHRERQVRLDVEAGLLVERLRSELPRHFTVVYRPSSQPVRHDRADRGNRKGGDPESQGSLSHCWTWRRKVCPHGSHEGERDQSHSRRAPFGLLHGSGKANPEIGIRSAPRGVSP